MVLYTVLQKQTKGTKEKEYPSDVRVALKDTLKLFEQRLFAVVGEKACGHWFLEYPSIRHLPSGSIVSRGEVFANVLLLNWKWELVCAAWKKC
jgi:hypothetical protein